MKLIYLLFISISVLSNYNLNAQNSFWEFYSLPGQWVSQIKIDRQNNFYAVCDSVGVKNLFRSRDALTWESILPPTNTQGSFLLLIDTTNTTFDRIYSLKQTSGFIDSLFSSTDYGETWDTISLPSALDSRIYEFAYNLNGDLYLPTRNTIQFTTNNGNSWENIITPSDGIENNIHLQIDRDGNIYTTSRYLYPPEHGGLFEGSYKSTNNGLTWVWDLSSWAHGEEFTAFEALPTGEMFAGAWADWDGLLYFKDSPNDSWHVINNFDAPVSMIINKYRYIYVVSSQVPSEYSPDYGTTWYKFDYNTLAIYDLAIDQDGYLYAATYPSGVYRSKESTFPIINEFLIYFPQIAVNDTASEEITIFNPFTSQLVIDSFLLSSDNFHLDTAPPFVLQPGDSELVTLYFSPDGWGIYDDTLTIYSNLKTSRIFLSGESPSPEFEIHPATPFLLFGTTYLDSTRTKTINIINHSINYLEIDSIYTHSTQFSVSSINFPVQIALDSITFVVSFAPDSNIDFVDTLFILNNLSLTPYSIQLRGKGVMPVRTLDESDDHFIFELSNNFPNPFNPATRIKFQLAEKIHVKLSVYNLLGEEISILA